MLSFETYYKHGRHWIYCGVRQTETSRGAAQQTGYVFNRKVIGVKPEDSRDKLIVHRFKYVPLLHHGR